MGREKSGGDRDADSSEPQIFGFTLFMLVLYSVTLFGVIVFAFFFC